MRSLLTKKKPSISSSKPRANSRQLETESNASITIYSLFIGQALSNRDLYTLHIEQITATVLHLYMFCGVKIHLLPIKREPSVRQKTTVNKIRFNKY